VLFPIFSGYVYDRHFFRRALKIEKKRITVMKVLAGNLTLGTVVGSRICIRAEILSSVFWWFFGKKGTFGDF